MTVLLLFVGLVVLGIGAEVLVRGASKIATAAGISPLIVGLTVVAFGTSAPELAVSMEASLTGQANVAVGNVVGSNIFNVLFILGVAAVIAPLTVSAQLVRIDVPVVVCVSILTFLLAVDGSISRIDGLLLVGGIIIYVFLLIRQLTPGDGEANGTQTDASSNDAPSSSVISWVVNLASVGVGLALLVLGARWFVDAAVQIAQRLGVSELVIGLTLVVGGTSLPELATSALAGFRGERDIAVGNVVGSNLFNLLAVLGLSALVSPAGIAVSDAVLWFDLPVMVAASVACLPVFFTRYIIHRWEGALFLAFHGAYTAYLILSTTQHDALSSFSWIMGGFVLPLTGASLLILAFRGWRRQGLKK